MQKGIFRPNCKIIVNFAHATATNAHFCGMIKLNQYHLPEKSRILQAETSDRLSGIFRKM